MPESPFAPDFENLPDYIPIFPLHGVLLLPRGQLPLNIFEKRYLEMVEDSMRSHRMIGMIQPERPADEHPIFKVGCAGKITSFQETSDGRYLITLTGICRFRIDGELSSTTRYRQAKVNWNEYQKDFLKPVINGINRNRLHDLLKVYFHHHELTCDWTHIENAPDERLITCLSMICPLDPYEKQALLEAADCEERAEKFMSMLEFAVKFSSCERCSEKCH